MKESIFNISVEYNNSEYIYNSYSGSVIKKEEPLLDLVGEDLDFLCENHFVVFPDLTLQSCTNPLQITNASFLEKDLVSSKKSFYLEKSCQKCQILPICLGGCPNKLIKYNYPACNPYKNIIKEVIIKYL